MNGIEKRVRLIGFLAWRGVEVWLTYAELLCVEGVVGSSSSRVVAWVGVALME